MVYRYDTLSERDLLALIPKEKINRWTPRKKEIIIELLAREMITIERLVQEQDLTLEEIAQWQRAVNLNGLGGVSVTKYNYFLKKQRDPAA